MDTHELTRKFMQTFAERAPKVVLILLLSFIAIRIAKLLLRQFERITAGRSVGDASERALRAKTLSRLLANACRVAVWVIAAITILNECGVNIAPLLAGVGVAGLAVGFGAQNLVKDVVTGFFIILENQYAIGDVIRANGVSGRVENVTLRATVLRDVDGTVHFIPNGQITVVSNMTKEWSCALIDVEVPYKEKLDEAIGLVRRVCDEIRKDETFGQMIVGDFEMPVVENLGAATVTIRITAKTKPHRQWELMREMRRRIKTRFEEAGIGNI